MSSPDPGSNGKSGVKTLAIRLEPDRHQQLSLIAQLRDSTITDEIRQAIDTHLAAAMADAELAAQAEGALADIERDAEARRAAITALFGTGQAASDSGGRRARRGSEAASAS